MAITIRDIAKYAQTFVSAVSLVLNEKWEKKVPKDTNENIVVDKSGREFEFSLQFR